MRRYSMQLGLLVSKKEMDKYDGWTCLAIVVSHVSVGLARCSNELKCRVCIACFFLALWV